MEKRIINQKQEGGVGGRWSWSCESEVSARYAYSFMTTTYLQGFDTIIINSVYLL